MYKRQAVNGTKGSLGGSYLSSIISDYTRELGSESSSQGLAGKPLSRVDITTQNLYNPTLNYKRFMIPALMVMLLTLICGFLPALNVAVSYTHLEVYKRQPSLSPPTLWTRRSIATASPSW